MSETKKSSTWKKIGDIAAVFGFVAIAVAVYNHFSGPSSKGISVGNLSASSGMVRFDIGNTGNDAGDVVVFVAIGDIERCVYTFSLSQGERIRNVSFPCDVGGGRFKLRYAWADTVTDRYAIARRLNF